jgi:hypothetical protein
MNSLRIDLCLVEREAENILSITTQLKDALSLDEIFDLVYEALFKLER